MSKKILDFNVDKPQKGDVVLITNPTNGTRVTSVSNLVFQYKSFSGTTDANGIIKTDLSLIGHHPISVYVENSTTQVYADVASGVYTVICEDWAGQRMKNASVSGTIYYVVDTDI